MEVAESSVTPAPTPQLSSGNQSSDMARKTRRSSRRILSEDQKREIVRLYAETTTSVPDLKKQFGIAESSLYRLIQLARVAPRGRVPAATRSASNSALLRTALNGDMALSRPSAQSRSRISRRQTPSVSPPSQSGVKYRVSFAAQQTVAAVDISDAIRQAEELG